MPNVYAQLSFSYNFLQVNSKVGNEHFGDYYFLLARPMLCKSRQRQVVERLASKLFIFSCRYQSTKLDHIFRPQAIFSSRSGRQSCSAIHLFSVP